MAVRSPIAQFGLANPLYKNASVEFMVAANGQRSSVMAHLFSGPSGLAQLPNPQKLDSQGKFKVPVYIEEPVIGIVTGISVPSHDTAIISPVPTFRFSASGFLEYSYDNGVTFFPAGQLAATTAASLVNFVQAGAGAVLRTVEAKERDIIGAADFVTLQQALTAAAGAILWGAGAVFSLTAATTIPSNIELRDMTLQCDAAAGQISATSQTRIRCKNVSFTSGGVFSNVPTFTLCDGLLYDDCLFDGAIGASFSSVGLRMFGSTNVVVNDCTFYDFDSCIYLDKSGATQSDKVSVFGSHFEHRVLQTGANPTGIYQFNCDHLLVDGCTFIDIRSGNAAPIGGYSVYEGDGIAVSLTVTNCLTKISTAHGHTMVQNSNAKTCQVTENKFFGKAIGVAVGAIPNQLYQGGAALGSIVISDNYCEQGGIFVTGGGTAATALRSAIINYNQIIKLEQATAGIRLGAQGTNFVSYAKVRGNTVYCTYAGSLNVSECEYAEVEGNFFLNWNVIAKVPTNTYAYTAGIYWQEAGVPSSGIIRDNILKNDTKVPAESGTCNYAIVGESATAMDRIRLYDNIIGPMIIANFVNVLAESGQYTPTLFNTTNVTASAAAGLNYMRLGQAVTVSGLATLDPTVAAPTPTQLGISLPFASNFTGANDAGGTAASTATESETYAIVADVANDRVVMDGLARGAVSHLVWLHFTYIVK